MRVLAVNSGSSSIKFRLLEVLERNDKEMSPGSVLLNGAVKGIGGTGTLDLTVEDGPPSRTTQPTPDHAHAVRLLFDGLPPSLLPVDAVGHRVVHGGERFTEPVVIDESVIKEIDALSELAPLHNPACLEGIHGARAVLGSQVPMVAVFDTAFHRTMPPVAKTYALPHKLSSQHGIHRYGFHGIAHASLVAGYAASTKQPIRDVRVVTLQLGNGCSVTAVAGGKSVETSMGFTPLEGLVMGTRSGDLDPTIITYLAQREKVDASEVERWLNEESGLLGLSGRSNDMRELLDAATVKHDEQSALAVDLFCYRARKYIGAYLTVLRGADAVVFGGGIGENAPAIRSRICDGMDWCGLQLDPERNQAVVGLAPGTARRISRDGSRLEAYVVAADEENWIALETAKVLRQGQS